jgi:hypothetical protein
MVDLVLRSDTVVTPQGVGAYDIAIAASRSSRWPQGQPAGADGARLIDAGKNRDARRHRSHVHCRVVLPNPDGTAAKPTRPMWWAARCTAAPRR